MNRSIRGNGTYMSVALRRLRSVALCLCLPSVGERGWCISIVYCVHDCESGICYDFGKL